MIRVSQKSNMKMDPRNHIGLMRVMHHTGDVMFNAIKALTDMRILKPEVGSALAYRAIAYMDKAVMEKRCDVAFVLDGDFVITIRREP